MNRSIPTKDGEVRKGPLHSFGGILPHSKSQVGLAPFRGKENGSHNDSQNNKSWGNAKSFLHESVSRPPALLATSRLHTGVKPLAFPEGYAKQSGGSDLGVWGETNATKEIWAVLLPWFLWLTPKQNHWEK